MTPNDGVKLYYYYYYYRLLLYGTRIKRPFIFNRGFVIRVSTGISKIVIHFNLLKYIFSKRIYNNIWFIISFFFIVSLINCLEDGWKM
jgi:hypothetical protein